MAVPKSPSATLAGAALVLLCNLAGTRINTEKLGVAWLASTLLLGFVSCAALLDGGNTQSPSKRRLVSMGLSVPLKAVCCWLVCFGMANLPLAVFCIALLATLPFAYVFSTSGFTPVIALPFALSLVCLVPTAPSLSAVDTFKTFATVVATSIGATIAVVFGVVQSRGWYGLDGYLSVTMLATLGFVQNLLVGNQSKTLSTYSAPLVFCAAGAALYVAARHSVGLIQLPSTGAGALAAIVVLLLTGAPVLSRSMVGITTLLASFFVTIVAAASARSKYKSGEHVTAVQMKPSHLFSKKEDRGDESMMKSLLSNARERKLAVFLLLTVGIMFLEFFYGISVNSLGLISDSFHMMLDGASIGIGLFAAHAASWKPNEKTHPFGYARYEVLGGFINGILLLFIAFYVMLESIERLVDPPEIEAKYLLLVSVVGLVVNIIGVIFFHDSHGHSHSHGECGSGGGGGRVDHNMRGVYLHILADLLGSVSVIISSIFIYLFNFWIADPICSALSATLILMSAFPLLEETGKILLLSGPPTESNFAEVLRKEVLASGLLIEMDVPKIWMHSTAPREMIFCVLSARMRRDENYSRARTVILAIVEKKIQHDLGVDNTNIVLNLE